jgi:hypothetical protein
MHAEQPHVQGDVTSDIQYLSRVWWRVKVWMKAEPTEAEIMATAGAIAMEHAAAATKR